MAPTTHKRERIGSVGSVLIALFLVSFFSSGAAEAETREWVGTSGGNWSTAANWDPIGAPADNDDLVFPTGTSAISVNDLAGVNLRSIRFEGSHSIQGASFSVAVAIEVLASSAIEASVQLIAGAAITGTGAPTLVVNGTFGSSGDFSIVGVLVEANDSSNGFNGTMTIGAGGTFLIGAVGALGPNGTATVGVHFAGGELRVDNDASNTTYAINGLTGNGTLDMGTGSPSGFFDVQIATANLFTGTILGNMVFVKSGNGTLTLGGTTNFVLSYLAQGEMVVTHAQALANTHVNVFPNTTLTYDVSSTRTGGISLGGTLRLRGGSVTQQGMVTVQMADIGTVAVAAPHQLVLSGQVHGNVTTLNIIGDGSVDLNNPTNSLSAALVGNGVVPGPTLRLGAPTALNGVVTTINAGGTLNLNGFTVTLDQVAGVGRIDTGAGGIGTFNANVNFTGTFHGAGSVNTMSTTAPVTLAGTHTLSGMFETKSPDLVVTGTMPAAVRSSGAKVTLAPGSVIGPLDFRPSGSPPTQLIIGDAIDPGGATTGGFDATFGAVVKPIFSSTTPRLTVNGAVNLSFAQLDLSNPGTVAPGVLTLIANDGTDPVVGIFFNMPLDGIVPFNGMLYVLDYKGGDGNDVTLSPPSTTYHLSEGATGTFFDTDLLLANPWLFEITVDVTFLPENAASLTQQYTLEPLSRRTIRVDEISGLESVSFSTIVKPTVEYPIAVERTMRWDVTGYGGHTEKATSGPATTWYFAEGSEGFFRTFLLLANPQPTANVAHVKWLREGAPAVDRDYNLLPSSRTTIGAIDDPELVNQAFGITVTFDQPGVAERAMYFGGPPLFKGGHESAGVTAPSTTWLLAEGATGAGFETFILVSNPGSEAADVTFTFLPSSGPPASLARTVQPNSRITVNPEAEDLPIPLGAVGTQITATRPVIAERAQYWPLGPVEWTEAHNSFGVTEAATHWVLAEGRVGGSELYQTYILLANPGNTTATVQLQYLDDGQTSKPADQSVQVPAQQRVNVAVPNRLPNNAFATFGTFITSDQPIAVERAMYWNAGGETWAAGTNATAAKIRWPF